MNRFHEITIIAYRNIEEKCYGIKKLDGYQHLYSVSTLCIQLAKKRNLNIELSAIIGVLHDYSTYYTGSSFDHANRSAMLANELLEKSELLNIEEITLVTTAIKNHSNKDVIDDEYSELIKDADIWYRYLYEPTMTFDMHKQKRIDTLLYEFNMI
ncbi:MAG: HD domain-containing protein [Coprobacillaceae bacterium]